MRLSDLYFSWWLRPGTARPLTSGGLKRSYVVHLPRGHELTSPLPVVLVLHGATMNGPMMAWFCDLNRKADQAGFIAVYPSGTGTRSSFFWNGGAAHGPATRDGVDDVAFISDVLDDLIGAYPVDAERVYATGMSNGAVMAYRLAAELSERIAAIAPVAGTLAIEECRPKHPVSVLHFHGTRDEYVPFSGGRGERTLFAGDYRSVEDSIRLWVRANGCGDVPKTDILSGGAGDLRVTRRSYHAGREGAEVILVVIEGGGHTWPGRHPAAKVLGRSTMSISANDLMWEFFSRHKLKGTKPGS